MVAKCQYSSALTNPVCILGVFQFNCSSCSQNKQQLWPEGTLHNFLLYASYVHSLTKRPCSQSLMLWSLPKWTTAMDFIWKLQLMQNPAAWTFKVLVTTYKTLQGMKLSSLRDCFFPIMSIHPINSSRTGTLPGNVIWQDPRRKTFLSWYQPFETSALRRQDQSQPNLLFVRP